MPTADPSTDKRNWFRTLLDASSDVYFRYELTPSRGFVYLSPSVLALTGHRADAFYGDPALCVALLRAGDHGLVGRILRARRGMDVVADIAGADGPVSVELRTVAVTRGRRIVAVEGVARLAGARAAREATGGGEAAHGDVRPTPQRLAALMYEVHELLHRVLPPSVRTAADDGPVLLRCGEVALDTERLTVSENGRGVTLTSRELMVLRYLLQRPGRVVTRAQLLTDVWGYSYTGDDRTVDVHVSRLRRKLPSLVSRLVTIKHVGYRIDDDRPARVANS